MSDIKFSIIIPTFNRAFIIAETIESVINQTYSCWECLIIDDGSADDTNTVIKRYAIKDNRIKYFYQNNSERSAARNNGIRNSTGDYILFLDSDDLFKKNYLYELSIFLAKNMFPKALIAVNYFMWDGVNEVEAVYEKKIDNAAEWLINFPVSPTRICIHHEITKNYKFDENITIVEDSVLWISITNEYPLLLLDKPLVSYRVHSGNSVNRSTTACFKRYNGLRLFFKSTNSKNISVRTKKFMLSDVMFRIAEYYRFKNLYFKAFLAILKSFKYQSLNQYSKTRFFFLLNLIPGFELIYSWKKKFYESNPHHSQPK